MRAELEIENVGGLYGKKKFELRSAFLNMVQAPNAAGKTSVIKGITAVLSLPCKRKVALEVATRLGIKGSGGPEPLVNTRADYATVTLSVNGERRFLEIRSDGRTQVRPNGNERFLFTSVLNRESEVVWRLMEGDSDFTWVARTVSLQEQYESVKAVVERIHGEQLLKLNDVQKRRAKILELENHLSEAKKKKEDARSEYENLQKEITLLPSTDGSLEKQRENLISDEGKKRDEFERASASRENVRKELELANRTLEKKQSENEANQRRLERIQEKLDALPTETERQEMQKEAQTVVERIPELREEKGKRVSMFNLYEDALKTTESHKTHDNSIKCPLCRVGYIKVKEIRDRSDELRREMKKIDTEIADCLNTRDSINQKINEISKTRESLTKERTSLRELIHTSGSPLRDQEKKVRAFELQLNSAEEGFSKARSAYEMVRDRLGEIESRIAKLDTRRERSLTRSGELRGKLDQLDDSIRTLEKQATEKYEIVADKAVMLNDAQKIYEESSRTLVEVLSLIDKRIEEQKKGVAKRFNAEIEKLLKLLNFREFDSVRINEDNLALTITRSGRPQALTSLSTSERNAISTLLQIAIKEAYMPEVPFIAIDEMILDFDRERVREIMNYLSEVARSRDWFVIIGRIGASEALEVKYAKSYAEIESA